MVGFDTVVIPASTPSGHTPVLALITRGTVLQPARQVPATTAATSSGGIVVILVGAGPGPGCAMFVVVAQLAAFRCIIHVRVSARNEVVAVVVSHVELFAGIVASRRRCGRDTGGGEGPTRSLLTGVARPSCVVAAG